MASFLIRISFCLVLCSILGLERQYHYKVIGIRTNLLVALGSFLFVYFSFGNIDGDQMRIAAAVVTGVGFLGAGVILQNGNKVIGIDTAATLWCVSSVGVLCAGGLLFESTIGTILILIANISLRTWTHKEEKKKDVVLHKCSIKIGCDEEKELDIRDVIMSNVNKDNITMESFEKSFTNKGSVHLNFVFVSKNIRFLDSLVNTLSNKDGVNKISWSHEIMNDSINI